MSDILQLIEESLDDDVLSEDEKTELRSIVKQEEFTLLVRTRMILRAISIAQAKLNGENHESVMRWLKRVSLILGNYEDSKHNNAYFSHANDIRKVILRAITGAKEGMDIAMFTISDDQIAEELLQAHVRGIKIRILTDDEKVNDRGSDMMAFKEAGIEVKIDSSNSLMHHKFMIVDGVQLYNGSYNWTRTAATKNNENLVVTDNKRIVQSFNKEFDRLWRKMKYL